jgi:hypothetical protein
MEPTCLTDDTRARYLHAARCLRSKAACAAYAGISAAIVFKWERAVAEGKTTDTLVKFFADVARERAEGANEILGHIQAAAPQDWRAGAWLLERMERREFAQHATVEVTGSGDEVGSAMREALRGMDWYTRTPRRMQILAEQTNGNGHADETPHSNGSA